MLFACLLLGTPRQARQTTPHLPTVLLHDSVYLSPPQGGGEGKSCPRRTQLVAFRRLDLLYRTPVSPAFPIASLVWHPSLKWLTTYLSSIILIPHLVQDFNPVVEPTWNQENSPWEVNIGSPKNIIVKVQATTPGIQISSPKSMSIQFQEVGAHK